MAVLKKPRFDASPTLKALLEWQVGQVISNPNTARCGGDTAIIALIVMAIKILCEREAAPNFPHTPPSGVGLIIIIWKIY